MRIEEITGEGVAEMRRGALTIRHFGVHGGKVDVRLRALVDSRGAFGKARARVGGLKAGIGLTGHDRNLTLLRVGAWYRKDDVSGMPPLLPHYGGDGDEEPEPRGRELTPSAAHRSPGEELLHLRGSRPR